MVPLSDPKWASLWAISEEFAWFFIFLEERGAWSVVLSELWVDMKVPRLRSRTCAGSLVLVFSG